MSVGWLHHSFNFSVLALLHTMWSQQMLQHVKQQVVTIHFYLRTPLRTLTASSLRSATYFGTTSTCTWDQDTRTRSSLVQMAWCSFWFSFRLELLSTLSMPPKMKILLAIFTQPVLSQTLWPYYLPSLQVHLSARKLTETTKNTQTLCKNKKMHKSNKNLKTTGIT